MAYIAISSKRKDICTIKNIEHKETVWKATFVAESESAKYWWSVQRLKLQYQIRQQFKTLKKRIPKSKKCLCW